MKPILMGFIYHLTPWHRDGNESLKMTHDLCDLQNPWPTDPCNPQNPWPMWPTEPLTHVTHRTHDPLTHVTHRVPDPLTHVTHCRFCLGQCQKIPERMSCVRFSNIYLFVNSSFSELYDKTLRVTGLMRLSIGGSCCWVVTRARLVGDCCCVLFCCCCCCCWDGTFWAESVDGGSWCRSRVMDEVRSSCPHK